MRSASGTTSGDFLQRPLFSGSLRVAMTQRIVEVRYQTYFELVGEWSASWAISLLLGYTVALILYFLIKGDPKAVVISGLQGVGVCDPPDTEIEVKDLHHQPKSPATHDEVTALKARLQLLEEALGKVPGVELVTEVSV